jgi:PAS domain S-box-containing protein
MVAIAAVISAVILFAGLRVNIRQRKLAEASLAEIQNDYSLLNTRLKSSESALIASTQKLMEFADSLPQMLYEIDVTGRFMFANTKALAALGFTIEDVENGVNAFDRVAPEDRARAHANMLKVLMGETFEAEEYALLKKDGTRLPVIIHSRLLTRNGAVFGIRGLAIDITDRKQAEIILRESEDKYRGLFEESRDVIFVSTPGDRFTDINPAGVRLFRYPSKEALLAANIAKDIHCSQSDRDEFHRILKRDGYVKDYELEMKTKDGEKLDILITSTALYDENGDIKEIRGIIRDVTEYKLLEAQLRQAQKMEAVGQLAGGISHDFNNILTTIIGYADLLKGHLNKSETSTRYLDELLASVERAASLTRGLLAFSRKQTLKVSPMDLNDTVRVADNLLTRLIGEDIEIKTKLVDRPLMVMADGQQIEQVLMNIATNARDAMPDGGTLSIETDMAELDANTSEQYGLELNGMYAVIAITDTGTGMDEQIAEKIFDPFFTTKEVGKGTGLGLAMVYGIIKQHDGYIKVTSRPGHGTTFRILIPLLSSSLKKPKAATNAEIFAEPSASSGTVLIAEDNSSVRKLMRLVLEKAGYTVIEAVDGDEAVTKFRECPDIDLVILDVIMPKKDGRQAYEEIRQIKPDARILLASGYTADVLRRKGILDGGPDLLQKPISPRALLYKVAEVIGR